MSKWRQAFFFLKSTQVSFQSELKCEIFAMVISCIFNKNENYYWQKNNFTRILAFNWAWRDFKKGLLNFTSALCVAFKSPGDYLHDTRQLTWFPIMIPRCHWQQEGNQCVSNSFTNSHWGREIARQAYRTYDTNIKKLKKYIYKHNTDLWSSFQPSSPQD